MSLNSYSENRSELRYDLRLPVQVSVESASAGAISALSENISAHGILLHIVTPIPQQTWLRLTIVVKPTEVSNATRLVAAGRVVRVERCPSSGFLVAVYCTRPFRMVEVGARQRLEV